MIRILIKRYIQILAAGYAKKNRHLYIISLKEMLFINEEKTLFESFRNSFTIYYSRYHYIGGLYGGGLYNKNDDYYNKYLKYKSKYLTLKKIYN